MMSIAFKEGLKIPPPAMNEIILGANQDIRQVNYYVTVVDSLEKCLMLCGRRAALFPLFDTVLFVTVLGFTQPEYVVCTK